MTPRRLSLAIITAITLVLPATVSAQGCPVGTKKTGEKRVETATKITIHPVCERMTRAELRARIDALDDRIKHVRGQLVVWRRDHLPQLQGELERWEELSQEARTEFFISAGNLLLAGMLDTVRGAVGPGRPLGAHAGELKRIAQDKATLGGVRPGEPAVERLREELTGAKRLDHVLDWVDHAREVATKGAALNLSHDVRGRIITAAFGAAYVAHAVAEKTPTPIFRLALAAGEFGMAVAWGGTVIVRGREDVEHLSTVAGKQVEAVTALATVYRETFEERATLRKLAQP